MVGKLRSRLTYANVTSTFALFLTVSGGTAIALSGTNSVNSLDIKNGQVSEQDLANAAVSRPKLRMNAVNGSRVADNSLAAADIDESTLKTSAKELIYKASRESGDTVRLASVGPYVFKASCGVGALNYGPHFRLDYEGPAGRVTRTYLEGEGPYFANETPNLSSSQITSGDPLISNSANYDQDNRQSGTIILESGSTVVTIQFDADATFPAGGGAHCSFHGTATLGS